MENIQNLKMLPWITEQVDIKKYFDEYNQVLDNANGMKPHYEQFTYKESMRAFFHAPDDLTARPASTSGQATSSKTLTRSDSLEDDPEKDPFSIEKMEKDCSDDLLTCKEELPPRELCREGPMKESGRVTNWFAGLYVDGVIPENGAEMLATLAAQAQELYKRETVKDYVRLRHRLLKYSQTMRMVMKTGNHPEDVQLQEDLSTKCFDDIIFNIRIYRPFYKRSYALKCPSRFPRYAQELLMLGSQNLSQLRDAIVCINDSYVHKDMSKNPDLSLLPSSNFFTRFQINLDQYDDTEKLFPSSFFYFNGTCYPDMRNLDSKDISMNIRKWSKKYPRIGEINSIKMEDKKLGDLKIRLGYPYLFQHIGNCEHLVVISDVRLMHRTDIQDPSRYPLSRGNPRKLSIKCVICNLLTAKWIVKDDPRLAQIYTHLCDKCLKKFSYNSKGEKLTNFKLYPFIDEFAAQAIRENRSANLSNVIEIKLGGPSSHIIIEPLRDGIEECNEELNNQIVDAEDELMESNEEDVDETLYISA